MTLGDKIKSLRKSMGLTQTELGEKVGVKKNAVSKWECGRVEDIPTATIKALASLFGVPTSYLIDDDAENAPAGAGKRTVSDEEIKFALFGGDGEITDAMYDEVRQFAAFVKRREADKKKE